MLVVARNTPATAALSSISTATALGSLPWITGERGRKKGRRGEGEGKRGRGRRRGGEERRGKRVRQDKGIMDIRVEPLTTKQNRVKQKKHALYTWHTHTVPPIQWSRVHHTLVYHCSVLTGLSIAHTRTRSPSYTEQGQAGLSCCSSVSYSQGTHTSHP